MREIANLYMSITFAMRSARDVIFSSGSEIRNN